MKKLSLSKEDHMIETIAAPLVVKAVEFLFDEGKKILEERRIQKQAEFEAPKITNEQKARQHTATTASPADSICTKQSALDAQIDETRLKSLEKGLAHLLHLCEIYKTNLYQAQEKYARFGSAYAPPHLLHEMKEAEEGLFDATQQLNDTLSKIYGREIVISDPG
jgi:hypothetical protein